YNHEHLWPFLRPHSGVEQGNRSQNYTKNFPHHLFRWRCTLSLVLSVYQGVVALQNLEISTPYQFPDIDGLSGIKKENYPLSAIMYHYTQLVQNRLACF